MEVIYSHKAEKQLESLPKTDRNRLILKIDWYIGQSKPISFAEPLSGYDAYRFRVGNYRIVFETHRDGIRILFIQRRDRVYKNL